MGVGRRIAASAAALALGTLLAGSASAAPFKAWLEPNGGFGFDAASTATALSAGVDLLPDSAFFANPSSGAPRITITTPPSISGTSVTNATFANPSTGSSTWTVTAQDRAYGDLWIVIQGHDPNDPNASYYDENEKIGLIVDPADPRWAIVHPSVAPTVSYLAYFVGDLAQGASFDVPISYAVAKALKVVQTSPQLCVFPQYRVNFLELSVPEPMATALLAFGGTLLAIRKRRRAR